MNAQDYKAGVLSTESAPTSLQINEITLHAVLALAIAAGTIVDQAKRQLFYGNKGMDKSKLDAAVNQVGNMANFLALQLDEDPASMDKRAEPSELAQLPPELQALSLDHIHIRRLHASLGLFTEGGELLELMLAQFEGKGMDNVGFIEELGDCDWYKTIGCDAAGVSEEVVRRINNQKLTDKKAGRYSKGAFTVQDAIERNTLVERSLMDAANDDAREGVSERAAA